MKMQTNYNPTYIPPSEQPAQTQQTALEDPNATESAEPTQPLSPQFAALAKQKRALQVKERELLNREKALSGSSGQTDSIALARLKSEPLDVLLEAGVTYEQLTEAILNNQGNSEINSLKAELKALKEGVDNKFVDRDLQAEKQVLAEMRREAEQLARNGEEFELVNGMGAVDKVMDLIERTYRASGEVLDTREALQLVEDELFKDTQKLTTFKKVQSQFNPPARVPQMQQAQGMRTLSNRDTASVPMTNKQRAIAVMQGTYKR